MSRRLYARSGRSPTSTTFVGSPATARRCPLPTNARSPFVAEIEQVRLDMGGFEVNSYVIHAPEGDLIVDAGAEPEKILATITQPVAAILLTHGHHDHVGALEDVRREKGAPVYAPPGTQRGPA